MATKRFFILHMENVSYIVTEWHYSTFIPHIYYFRINNETIIFKLARRGKKFEHYERV
jgi:hypothetical protein